MSKNSLLVGRLLVPSLLCLGWLSAAQAADATFVGMLALAVEEEGVRRLGLSEDVRTRLVELIDRRERQALGLALEIKDLPADEIRERLAPFVAASERQGLALLSAEQRSILQQMQVAHRGMSSLADSEMARALGLSQEQQGAVKQLIDDRNRALTRGGAIERRMTADRFEREMKRLLTPEQRANWEQLAGLTAPGEPAETGSPTGQPSSDSEADARGARSAPSGPAESTAELLYFNFQHAAWGDVLEWFAAEADLSLQLDVLPKGTFNYRDTRGYTPAQALDLVNGFLLFRGYTLVRRGRLLTLLNVEDEIPPQFIELVPLEELDSRGEFTLLKCLFKLARLSAEDAKAEIESLLGPQGEIVVLPKSGQVMVTETAGKLRMIRSVIESIEDSSGGYHESVVEIPLRYVTPEDVLTVARPLLGLAEGENVSADDADAPIRLAVDPFSPRILASGDRASIRRLQEIVPLVDRSLGPSDQPMATLQQPQFATYQIVKADTNQVKQVLETLLQGLPDVRMSIDPLTNKLILLAPLAEHRKVRETLRLLEGEAEQIEVISLRKRDPQLVIQAINHFFGTSGEEDTTGPKVTGDPGTRKLWVRGTTAQIEQIKDLVEKLEGPSGGLADGPRQSIRVLPFSGSTAQQALQSIEALWPQMRSNRIRVVTPSAVGSTLRERTPSSAVERTTRPGSSVPQEQPERRRPPRPQRQPSAAAGPGDAADAPAEPVTFVSWLEEDKDDQSPPPEGSPSDQPVEDARDARSSEQVSPTGQAEIIITETPNGLIIASEDLDALDDFEQLLRSLMGPNGASGNEPTVFWLKYEKAEVAAELVRQVLTGTTSTSSSPSVLGEVGGELLGGLLGLGGAASSVATGSAIIVPDVRLNALIVQASPIDLGLIERILPVIDREAGPAGVETGGVPRLIPVNYMAAEEMAEILKQVYVGRINGGGNGQQQQRQPSPADFFRQAFGRGRGSGGGGSNNQAQQEPPKMTIGVDVRSNSLIVTASEPVFREVKALVEEIDQEGLDTGDAVSVVTIKQTNPELIQQALQSIVGDAVQTSGATSSSSSGAAGGSGTARTPSASGGSNPDAAALQRRIEAIRALRSGGFGRGAFGGGARGTDGGRGAGDAGRQGFGGRGGLGGQRGGGAGRGRGR